MHLYNPIGGNSTKQRF